MSLASLLARREDLDRRILALLADGRERYCVEIGEALGCPGARGQGTAKSRLNA